MDAEHDLGISRLHQTQSADGVGCVTVFAIRPGIGARAGCASPCIGGGLVGDIVGAAVVRDLDGCRRGRDLHGPAAGRVIVYCVVP